MDSEEIVKFVLRECDRKDADTLEEIILVAWRLGKTFGNQKEDDE